MSIQAYPLSWPAGWKRTASHARIRAKFGKRQSRPDSGWRPLVEVSMAEATSRVLHALRILGVQNGDAIISTNVVLRLDGYPKSGQRDPEDPGVCVYWERQGDHGRQCMAIDLYDRVADNLAAIAATLEALRAIERHGGAEILNRAFTGFTALPAPGQTTGRSWQTILKVESIAKPTFSEVEAQYRRLRSLTHPDRPGGNAEEFDAVQRAWEQAQQALS